MFKKLRNAGIIAGSALLVAGIAFAAFSITKSFSNGNTITSGNADITVTSTPFNLTGLVKGGSTANNPATIQNTGSYPGDVILSIVSTSGTLCADLTLNISGDKTESFSPIANANIDLGTLNPGQTWNLNQAVSLSATSTHLGSNCLWNESVTFSGN